MKDDERFLILLKHRIDNDVMIYIKEKEKFEKNFNLDTVIFIHKILFNFKLNKFCYDSYFELIVLRLLSFYYIGEGSIEDFIKIYSYPEETIKCMAYSLASFDKFNYIISPLYQKMTQEGKKIYEDCLERIK